MWLQCNQSPHSREDGGDHGWRGHSACHQPPHSRTAARSHQAARGHQAAPSTTGCTRQHQQHQADEQQMSSSTSSMGSTSSASSTIRMCGSTRHQQAAPGTNCSTSELHQADEPPGEPAVLLPELEVMPAHIVEASLGRIVPMTQSPVIILRASVCHQVLPERDGPKHCHLRMFHQEGMSSFCQEMDGPMHRLQRVFHQFHQFHPHPQIHTVKMMYWASSTMGPSRRHTTRGSVRNCWTRAVMTRRRSAPSPGGPCRPRRPGSAGRWMSSWAPGYPRSSAWMSPPGSTPPPMRRLGTAFPRQQFQHPGHQRVQSLQHSQPLQPHRYHQPVQPLDHVQLQKCVDHRGDRQDGPHSVCHAGQHRPEGVSQ